MNKILKTINWPQNERTKISLATSVLVVTLFCSNILGMIRDRILVSIFPTEVLDTYFAAFRIPDLVYNLLILGALSLAFIPVFSSFISKGENKKAWDLVNSILSLGFLILIIVSFILFLIAPYLIRYIVAPGFDATRTNLTVNLTRIMLVSPILLGISGIFSGILNSFKRFMAYSLTPLLYNLGIIFGALFLSKPFGIYGVALGVILGATLHLMVQLPSVIYLGYRFKFYLNLYHEGLSKISKLMVPRTIGLAAQQINLLVNTFIGSLLKSGSIAVLNFANNIQTLPTVVFGLSFATTIFPNLAEKAALEKKEDFVSDLSWGIRQVLFLIIPASIGVILLRAYIVRLILGSKIFSWSDTRLTAAALGLFCLSLFAQALIPLLARAFYALHDTKTPMLIALYTTLINVILSFLLTRLYMSNIYFFFLRVTELKIKTQMDPRVIGLALAFSIASVFNMILLLTYLKKRIEFFDGLKILKSTSKILVASTIMGIAVYGTLHLLSPIVSNLKATVEVGLQLLGAITVGILVYLSIAWILDIEEIKALKKLANHFKYKLPRS